MTAFDDLISSLGRAGLWASLSDEDQRAASMALASGANATWTAGGAWRADGEDLADGGVEPWLSAMCGPLRECGVELVVSTLVGPFDKGSTGYSIEVNGSELDLYRFDPTAPGLPVNADPWLDCTIVPLAAVNRLLTTAGSTRRLAAFWPGGNDGIAVLGDEDALRRAASAGTVFDYRIP